MKDRGIYKVGKPFYIKVVFTGEEINAETDSILTKAMTGGYELLPGLRLEAIFGQFVTKDLLMVDELTEDLRRLDDIMQDVIRKYDYKGQDIREKNIAEMDKED